MVWDRRMRIAAGVVFLLIWVPFILMFHAGMTGGDADIVFTGLPLAVILCLLFVLLLLGSSVIGRFEKERIRKTGIRAEATVTSVTDTGARISDQPLIIIELEVSPPYGAPFAATVEYLQPEINWQQLRPGQKVPVFWTEGTQEVALAGR